MKTKDIVNKLENILDQYKEEQVDFYTQYEQAFIRDNFEGYDLFEALDGNFGWDINSPEEGFSYDIGYINGLEKAIMILKEDK